MKLSTFFLLMSVSLVFNQTLEELTGGFIIADQSKKRVIILPADKNNWTDSDIMWQWDAYNSWGTKMSDARRVMHNGELHILVTGSSNDLALVNFATKEVVYQTTPPGSPHASALLPGGVIATADSRAAEVNIYVLGNKNSVQTFSHAGIHCVVWDAERERLWAWGGNKMEEYSYNENTQRVTSENVNRTPDSWGDGIGGHGMAPIIGTTKLIFTWSGGLGTFDVVTGEFARHTTDIEGGLKGVDHNPATDEIIYFRANPDIGVGSRSDLVRSLKEGQPDRRLEGGIWYRGRWFVPNTFSYPDDVGGVVVNNIRFPSINHRFNIFTDKSSISVETDYPGDYSIYIYDGRGTLAFKTTGTGFQRHRYRGVNSSGMYIIHATAADFQSFQKVFTY